MSKRSVTYLALSIGAALFVSVFFVLSPALQAEAPQFVGAAKCKMCHKAEYESWMATAHAKAFDKLKPEQQKDAKCIKCHTTGFGKAQAEGSELQGVQCEGCHGAGSLYKSATNIMNKAKWTADPKGQRKLAVEAGLTDKIDETLCKTCHNPESPTFESFDFAKAHPKIQHKPSAPAAATEKPKTETGK
jgi:hypothetical protein